MDTYLDNHGDVVSTKQRIPPQNSGYVAPSQETRDVGNKFMADWLSLESQYWRRHCKIDQVGKARVPASRGGRKKTDGDRNEGIEDLRRGSNAVQ